MEPRSHDPHREMHEQRSQPEQNTGERLSAQKARDRAVERENGSQAAEERQGSHSPPSTMRETGENASEL
jgi:hypothetical protein